jgi:hypothetical protein
VRQRRSLCYDHHMIPVPSCTVVTKSPMSLSPTIPCEQGGGRSEQNTGLHRGNSPFSLSRGKAEGTVGDMWPRLAVFCAGAHAQRSATYCCWLRTP